MHGLGSIFKFVANHKETKLLNRIYSWSNRLFAKSNDGDLYPEDFTKKERAFNRIDNRGEDFGYGNSQTKSFEL